MLRPPPQIDHDDADQTGRLKPDQNPKQRVDLHLIYPPDLLTKPSIYFNLVPAVKSFITYMEIHMSLEQALAANTAALQALTAALVANPSLGAPFTAAVAPVPTAPVASTDISPAPTTAFAQPAAIAPQPATTAAPLTAPPAPLGNVERDSKGMPYDGRIHSASKNKVADGSWRYKRGCDEAVIAQVEAELRAAIAAAPAPVGGVGTPWPFPAEPAVPPVPAVVVAAAPAVATVAPPPVVASPPVAAVAVPVPPAAGVGGIDTYEKLMAALPPKIVSGELTPGQMQQACEQYGVPSIAALATRPDLVPFVAATLGLK